MADFNDYFIKPRKLLKLIKNLEPTPGIAILINMVGSSILKGEETKVWTRKMRDTFLFALKSFKPINESVVKLIDYEMFIYVPDDRSEPVDYLKVFQYVKTIISNFNKDIGEELIGVKGAMHYCDDVYNITVHERQNDFHGLGLELTEILLSKSSRDILVLSDTFYDTFKNNSIKIKDNIKGPNCFRTKGINRLVKFYKLDCNVTQM